MNKKSKEEKNRTESQEVSLWNKIFLVIFYKVLCIDYDIAYVCMEVSVLLSLPIQDED